MRKIVSANQKEKKQKRVQIIVGIILIFVMFGSVFGVIVGNSGTKKDSKINYNGFKFIEKNNFWFVELGEFIFRFSYNPEEIIEVASDLKYLDNYQDKPLYIYSEDINSEIEISANLQQVTQRIQYACLSEEECNGDFPIKTCEDNFIIIRESEVAGIKQDNNCVFIEGKNDELSKLSDDFLFYILNIR